MGDSIAFGGRGFRRQNRRFLRPIVTSVSPTTAVGVVPSVVTITGANFARGATVRFNNVLATNVVWNSSTSITCTTPLGNISGVIVTVMNPDAGLGTLVGGFAFIALALIVFFVVPVNGLVTIPSSVTINGTNENTLPCILQKLRAYPIDVTTANL